MPRVSSRLLEDGYAQAAENCDFRRGKLEPSRAPLDTGVNLGFSTESIYWYNRAGNGGDGFWFEWDTDVDVVRGPIANDVDLRVYFTGDGVPGFTDVTLGQSGTGPYPGARYDLGIPVPDAPTANSMTGEPPDGFSEEQTGYVLTFVDKYGAEGAPSAASNEITRWDGDSQTVSLTSLDVATGNFDIPFKNIYRLTSAGVYQFVAQIPNANTTYEDGVDNPLGEPVPSDGWLPPHPDMIGLTAVPGGIMMGWWDNTVAFCVPGQPHAWPLEYRYALEYDVVGAAVGAQGILVVTKGKPYMFMGTSPASYQPIQMDHPFPGLNKRSVVDMGDYIMYASPEGLVAVGGPSPGLISEAHIKPEQWRAKYGKSTLIATRWHDQYLGFYDGSGGSAFTFHPRDGFQDFDQAAEALWSDPQTGDVYIKQGLNLYQWDSGANETYEWVSGEFNIPPQRRYGVAKVDADSYPVTFEFYRDGALAKSLSVTSRQSFRLPTQQAYSRCHIRVAGSAPINFIQLASGKDEII